MPFAVSYLADKAHVWFQSRTIERRTNNRPPYGSWEDFLVELIHTFALNDEYNGLETNLHNCDSMALWNVISQISVA